MAGDIPTFNPDDSHRYNRQLTELGQRVLEATDIVCLTGAGASAESGVPTFRDAQTGLWSQYDPEELASQAGFAANPGLVWQWYMMRLNMVEEADPNAGHIKLAMISTIPPQFTLITQNVDDLHERSGIHSVLHLHGNIARFRCNDCRAEYQLIMVDRSADEPPSCRVCGGPIRPDVVWFGEMLPREAITLAEQAIRRCDLLIVIGTSGIVYPAAMLPIEAKRAGAFVVDINPQYGPTAEDADMFIQGPSGSVLPDLVDVVHTMQE